MTETDDKLITSIPRLLTLMEILRWFVLRDEACIDRADLKGLRLDLERSTRAAEDPIRYGSLPTVSAALRAIQKALRTGQLTPLDADGRRVDWDFEIDDWLSSDAKAYRHNVAVTNALGNVLGYLRTPAENLAFSRAEVLRLCPKLPSIVKAIPATPESTSTAPRPAAAAAVTKPENITTETPPKRPQAARRHDQAAQVVEFAKAHPGWGPDRVYAALKDGKDLTFTLPRSRVRKLVPPSKRGRPTADQAENLPPKISPK